MARPRKSQVESRSKRIHIAVNSGEAESLTQNARQAGMTVSNFLRHAGLHKDLPKRATAIEAEAVAALNRVGSNINQIAKIGHSSGSLNKGQISALITGYNETIKIVAQIKGAIQ